MSDADDIIGLDEEFNLTDAAEIEAVAGHHEQIARATSILRERKTAYSRVFRDGNASLDDIKVVVEDLSRFCRKTRSTFHPNVQMAARLDGRREVILRVFEYLDLSTDELVQLKL